MKASIVIPNFNGLSYLGISLPSLKQQIFRDFEILVVDNASSDSSVRFIKETYPDVKVVGLKENRGFAGGINAGIKVAEGDYIALLNNDTEVDKNWLGELVRVLDRDPDVGFATSKMLRFNERDIIDGVGDGFDGYGFAFKRGRGERDWGQYDNDIWVLGADGGAAIYRREIFDNIGLFDEDFFAYFEDLDLSMRAQLAGYKCMYVSNSVVYHVGHGTSDRISNFTFRLMVRNRISLIFKNIPIRLLTKYSPKLLYGQLRVALRAIIDRQFIAYLSGVFGAMLQLPKTFSKRRQVQSNIKVPISYFESLINPTHDFKRGIFSFWR